MYEVRYDDGGFYLVIDDIKGYFNVDDNVRSILNMILTDDQKNKYHQVWYTKSLIEKDNKFYLELALNRCLFEPNEIKL